MKQVIFLGFHCQIYKKAPTARIYVGDVMIDEIEIPEYCPAEYMRDGQLTYLTDPTIDQKFRQYKTTYSQYELTPVFYEQTHSLDTPWFYFYNLRKTFAEICLHLDKEQKTARSLKYPKLFVYVINDEVFKKSKGEIRIEVKNSDNNYANGFITKSTLVYLSAFYIIPYGLLQDPIEHTQRYLDLFSRKATSHSMLKILKFYKRRPWWPCNFVDYVKLKEKDNERKTQLVFGTDATLTIKLKQKYKTYLPEEFINRGFFFLNWLFIKDFLVGLSDKYKQDENQRNTN